MIVQPNAFSSSICVYISAWKVSKCGVFSGTYFPALGLNTERYSRMRENTNQKNLRIWTLSRNVYIMYMYIYYTIYWELRAYQHSSDHIYIYIYINLGINVLYIFIHIYIFYIYIYILPEHYFNSFNFQFQRIKEIS